MRERLFNWLGQDLTGRICLDLFAGTGVLGFESASRGAAAVTLVEQHPRAFAALTATKTALKADNVTLQCADALTFLIQAQKRAQQFDLIFLDPPYRQGWMDKIAPLLKPLLTPGGEVYAESEMPLPPQWAQLHLSHTRQVGQVHAHLFTEVPQ